MYRYEGNSIVYIVTQRRRHRMLRIRLEITAKTNIELPAIQKDPAGQAPEHRKLVSCVEEPNLPAAHGNLPPFVQ